MGAAVNISDIARRVAEAKAKLALGGAGAGAVSVALPSHSCSWTLITYFSSLHHLGERNPPLQPWPLEGLVVLLPPNRNQDLD